MKKINLLTARRSFGFLTGVTIILLMIGYVSLQSFQIEMPQKFTTYTEEIPGSDIDFQMIAVKGGSFLMGSPKNEKGREEDEGPVHMVKLDPFWMGKHEVTWDEFELFVYYQNFPLTNNEEIDAISGPTPPFVDMSFGMGKNGYPAVNMTQYAALNYCRWLTAKTGNFYRLPTEAEWEYASRAGTTTAFHFGDNPSKLSEYAWYFENSDDGYRKVGIKKPNPWGLYDMHGNVAEWTLDQYLPRYQRESEVQVNPLVEKADLYPTVVRGGSWDDDAQDLRSAARMQSSSIWKQRDPQIPKSNWWMTDASFVGFRIVRPLHKPSPEEIKKYFKGPFKDY